MPIVRHDDGTVLVIGGLGDLGIVAGNLADEPALGFVEFMPGREPGPVGEDIPGSEEFIGQDINELRKGMGFQPGVRLIFANVQVLDLLVENLMQARRFMVENQGESI